MQVKNFILVFGDLFCLWIKDFLVFLIEKESFLHFDLEK